MQKKYLVTGNWTDKTTGKPVTGIVEVNEGINKNGRPYAMANTDSREFPIDGTYPVGTILIAEMNFLPQKPQSTVKL